MESIYLMALDQEVLLLDHKGIFPYLQESEKSYLARGWQIVRGSSLSSMDGYALEEVQKRAEARRLFSPSSEVLGAKERALRFIQERYGIDLSWSRVYCARLPEDGLGGYTGGIHFPASEREIQGGTALFPPFVVVNSFRQGERAIQDTLAHELIHLARYSCIESDVNYGGWREYEERIARTRITRALVPGSNAPLFNFDYTFARWKLKRAFGEKVDYVLLHLPYEEVKDFFIHGIFSKDPRETIAILAKRGRLRYQILQEQLNC